MHDLRAVEGNADTRSLKTDDVGVFLSPLSDEFLLAAEHFRLDRRDLLDLCEGASHAIFGGEEEAIRIQDRVAAFRAELTVKP